jgi:hypothetical protein
MHNISSTKEDQSFRKKTIYFNGFLFLFILVCLIIKGFL